MKGPFFNRFSFPSTLLINNLIMGATVSLNNICFIEENNNPDFKKVLDIDYSKINKKN